MALGTALLWFGCYGFNAGSAFASGAAAVVAHVNTSLAAAAAMCAWSAVEWAATGRPSLVGSCIGAVAGMAAITPAAGFVRPWAAYLIGLVAGPLCYGCVELVRAAGWDDALDVWGVHGMGGLTGSILLGALGDDMVSGGEAGRSGGFFGRQVAGGLLCSCYSFAVSLGLLLGVDRLLPVLPTAEQTHEGLDASMHGEHAYDADALAARVRKAVLQGIDSAVPSAAGATEAERVRALFGRLDADGSGAVSREELLAALQDMGVDMHAGAAAAMVAEADADGSGELDLTEFRALITRMRAEAAAPARHGGSTILRG